MSTSKIPSKVLAELNRQINHELAAAHAYLAMSVWCRIRNFTGVAAFFAKQAGEERKHADKLIAHLIDRGAAPELEGAPAPKQDFRTLLDLAQHARTMEQANTRGIHAVYESSLVAKDYPAQVLMHWFINEQVEEEAWTEELIARVQDATCAGGLSNLDRHLEEFLGDDKPDKS